jgi:hypothetical protein
MTRLTKLIREQYKYVGRQKTTIDEKIVHSFKLYNCKTCNSSISHRVKHFFKYHAKFTPYGNDPTYIIVVDRIHYNKGIDSYEKLK